jgi:hypothetical protein
MDRKEHASFPAFSEAFYQSVFSCQDVSHLHADLPPSEQLLKMQKETHGM